MRTLQRRAVLDGRVESEAGSGMRETKSDEGDSESVRQDKYLLALVSQGEHKRRERQETSVRRAGTNAHKQSAQISQYSKG